jgi:carbohydrate kinase (thermoresistant glucokinase family)
MPRHALVVMGAAGAGKSRIGAALATALGARFVEGDVHHPPANIAKMAAGTPLTDDDRQEWLDSLAGELRRARDTSQGAVLACSALKRRYRDILRDGDADVAFVHLATGGAVLRDRLAARRGHFMPASLVDSQLATLEPPSPDERALTVDATDDPARIVTAVLQWLRAEPAA